MTHATNVQGPGHSPNAPRGSIQVRLSLQTARMAVDQCCLIAVRDELNQRARALVPRQFSDTVERDSERARPAQAGGCVAYRMRSHRLRVRRRIPSD